MLLIEIFDKKKLNFSEEIFILDNQHKFEIDPIPIEVKLPIFLRALFIKVDYLGDSQKIETHRH